MTATQIRQALFDWISLQVGPNVTVIQVYQKGPRPKRPYVSMKFIADSIDMGGQDIQLVQLDGTIVTAGMRRAVCSINVFSKTAFDIANRIRDSLDRPDVIEYFELNSISELDRSAVVDLTSLEETDYAFRAQFDVSIGFVAESTADVGTIETVELEGLVDEIEMNFSN